MQLRIQKDKAAFKDLRSMAVEIETEIGDPLTWHDSPDEKGCKIYLRRSADLNQRDVWPEYHSWLLDHLEGFYRAFVPRIRRLSGTGDSETGKALEGE